MTKKAKKAAKTTKASTRRTLDWKKFFTLCERGLTNAEVAEQMGFKLDKDSDDALKPIRAMRSRAQTIGVRIDGKLTKLHAPKSGSKVSKVARKHGIKKVGSHSEAKPKATKKRTAKQPKVETPEAAAASA